eukprot:TRINITY_DN80597_c0_g1_i1.p1 TRINITY_DN80597_c0_g1~~TRINITY_DN80597_c0_g1_i1.p1  ORF type:complete len:447 (-),score=76.71 TRINITY_DN80597_c0_g1_i1:50-1390(-)
MPKHSAMVASALEGASGKLSPEEHRVWALKMWKRMDRNESDSISRDELDCQELRTILRGILSPERAHTGGLAYERVQQNVDQACGFCLRKADLNNDGQLSFEEFSSFLYYLSHTRHAAHTAHLIFALFDLDYDGRLDEYEFQEVYRFYAGRNPTAKEFQEAWASLDRTGSGQVSLAEYCGWLQNCADPVFRQHAPDSIPAEVGSSQDAGGRNTTLNRTTGSSKSVNFRTAGSSHSLLDSSVKTIKMPGSPPATASTAVPLDSAAQTAKSGFSLAPSSPTAYKMDFPDLPIHPSVQRMDPPRHLDWAEGLGSGPRPPWNRHLKVANMNDVVPRGLRNYFSKPQSLPELRRYYCTHKGFLKHRALGAAIPEAPRKSPVLSTHMETPLPYRHEPAGTMKKRAVSGPIVKWEDEWLTPVYLKPRYKPGSLDFQHPGPPPRWMLHYKEDAD